MAKKGYKKIIILLILIIGVSFVLFSFYKEKNRLQEDNRILQTIVDNDKNSSKEYYDFENTDYNDIPINYPYFQDSAQIYSKKVLEATYNTNEHLFKNVDGDLNLFVFSGDINVRTSDYTGTNILLLYNEKSNKLSLATDDALSDIFTTEMHNYVIRLFDSEQPTEDNIIQAINRIGEVIVASRLGVNIGATLTEIANNNKDIAYIYIYFSVLGFLIFIFVILAIKIIISNRLYNKKAKFINTLAENHSKGIYSDKKIFETSTLFVTKGYYLSELKEKESNILKEVKKEYVNRLLESLDISSPYFEEIVSYYISKNESKLNMNSLKRDITFFQRELEFNENKNVEELVKLFNNYSKPTDIIDIVEFEKTYREELIAKDVRYLDFKDFYYTRYLPLTGLDECIDKYFEDLNMADFENEDEDYAYERSDELQDYSTIFNTEDSFEDN